MVEFGLRNTNLSAVINKRGELSKIPHISSSPSHVSEEILLEFTTNIPNNATIDVSFNNLTDHVPEPDPSSIIYISIVKIKQATISHLPSRRRLLAPSRRHCRHFPPCSVAPPVLPTVGANFSEIVIGSSDIQI
ncbi:hypothetical protein ACS0TY_016626 [Phlomoides rotata]